MGTARSVLLVPMNIPCIPDLMQFLNIGRDLAGLWIAGEE